MAHTTLSTIMDQVSLEIPRCPAAYLQAAVRRAAVDFFRESEVWRKTLDPISLVADQAAYKLDPAEGTAGQVDIWRIIEATDQDAEIDPNTYLFDYKEVTSVWGYYLEYLEDYVPASSTANALEVTVALAPSMGSSYYIDPHQVNQWSVALYEGALAALYALPSRPWYNPGEATLHRNLYQAQLALARQERTQQFTTDGALRASNPEGWL